MVRDWPRDVGYPPDDAPRATLRPVAAPRHAAGGRGGHRADGAAAGGGVEGQGRRVGKGALAPCPPSIQTVVANGGHASLCPPFCNGPRLVNPFALSARRGLASVRGRRRAAT